MLGFYCRASIVYNIMRLALILILYFSSPLSEENAVGVRFQSHTEYKIIANHENEILSCKLVYLQEFLLDLSG